MKTFTITLTEHQLHVINAALQEMPHKLAAPVINDMSAQLRTQTERSADIAEAPEALGSQDRQMQEAAE